MNVQEIDPDTLQVNQGNITPSYCFECEFDGYFPLNFFKVKPNIETETQMKEASIYFEAHFGFQIYRSLCSGDNSIVAASKCPKCGSRDLGMKSTKSW